MRHCLLSHHVQKEILYKRNVYRKDFEQAFIITEEKNCREKNKNRLGNIDWCKYGCECKYLQYGAIFAVSFCCRDKNEIPYENFKDT